LSMSGLFKIFNYLAINTWHSIELSAKSGIMVSKCYMVKKNKS